MKTLHEKRPIEVSRGCGYLLICSRCHSILWWILLLCLVVERFILLNQFSSPNFHCGVLTNYMENCISIKSYSAERHSTSLVLTFFILFIRVLTVGIHFLVQRILAYIGTYQYFIFNRDTLIDTWSLLFYTKSVVGSSSSQLAWRYWIKWCTSCSTALLAISNCPLVLGCLLSSVVIGDMKMIPCWNQYLLGTCEASQSASTPSLLAVWLPLFLCMGIISHLVKWSITVSILSNPPEISSLCFPHRRLGQDFLSRYQIGFFLSLPILNRGWLEQIPSDNFLDKLIKVIFVVDACD